MASVRVSHQTHRECRSRRKTLVRRCNRESNIRRFKANAHIGGTNPCTALSSDRPGSSPLRALRQCPSHGIGDATCEPLVSDRESSRSNLRLPSLRRGSPGHGEASVIFCAAPIKAPLHFKASSLSRSVLAERAVGFRWLRGQADWRSTILSARPLSQAFAGSQPRRAGVTTTARSMVLHAVITTICRSGSSLFD